MSVNCGVRKEKNHFRAFGCIIFDLCCIVWIDSCLRLAALTENVDFRVWNATILKQTPGPRLHLWIDLDLEPVSPAYSSSPSSIFTLTTALFSPSWYFVSYPPPILRHLLLGFIDTIPLFRLPLHCLIFLVRLLHPLIVSYGVQLHFPIFLLIFLPTQWWLVVHQTKNGGLVFDFVGIFLLLIISLFFTPSFDPLSKITFHFAFMVNQHAVHLVITDTLANIKRPFRTVDFRKFGV